MPDKPRLFSVTVDLNRYATINLRKTLDQDSIQYYYLYYNTNSDMANSPYVYVPASPLTSVVTDIFKLPLVQAFGLRSNTNYYFVIQSNNGANFSDSSDKKTNLTSEFNNTFSIRQSPTTRGAVILENFQLDFKYVYKYVYGTTTSTENDVNDPTLSVYSIVQGGLTDNTLYTFYLKRYGNLTYSDGVNITTFGIPSKPSVSASGGNLTITVTFSTASKNGLNITAYQLLIGTGSPPTDTNLNKTNVIPTSPSTIFEVNTNYTYTINQYNGGNLTGNQTYYIRVQAYNAYGYSDAEITSAVPYTIPEPPIVSSTVSFGVSAGGAYISADFYEPTHTGGNIRFEYQLDYVGNLGSPLGWNTSTASKQPQGWWHIDITPPSYGPIYQVQLRTRNDAGESSGVFFRNADNTRKTAQPYVPPNPPDPGAIYLTNGSTEIRVTFYKPAENGSPITKYKYQLNNGTWSGEVDATAESNYFFFTIPSAVLTKGTPYSVRVLAKNSAGDGTPYQYKNIDGTVTYVTPFAAPSAPGTVGTFQLYNNNTQIQAYFSVPTNNNGAAVTSYQYKMHWATSSTTEWITIVPYHEPSYSSIIITPPSYGPTYSVQIRAYNGEYSDGSFFMDGTNTVKTITPYKAPDAPSPGSISLDNTYSNIRVEFFEPNANGSPITKYKYRLNTGSWSGEVNAIAISNYFYFIIPYTALTYGTEHLVSIRAVNSAGDGTPYQYTYSVIPFNKPGPPASLGLTEGFGSIGYTIGAVTNTNGNSIKSYAYSVGSGNTTYTNIGLSYSGTIYNLANGVTHTVNVVAYNDAGISTSATTTTKALPPQTVSIIPTKNYFFYNGNSLDTIFKLNPIFNGTTVTNYKNNEIDIGRRYLTGTRTTTTNYTYQSNDLNTKFITTTITNASSLPIDKLSVTTKNIILPNETTPDTNILTAAPTTEASISAGVYGCKLLFSSYTGPVMTIQSSINNVTGHFFADTNGNLGSAYLATGTTLSTWLNGATAYVQIWWDQTGNGNHAYQFDNGLQPIYDSTNKYITFTGDRYFNLRDKTHPYLDNSQYTYVFKCSITSTSGGIFGGGLVQDLSSNSFRRDGNGYRNYWYNNDIAIDSGYQDNCVISLVYNGTMRYIYKNKNLLISDTPNRVRNQPKTNNTIGRTVVITETMKGGYIEYMYIIPRAISDSDRNILESTYFTYNYNLATNCAGCYSMRLAIPTYTGPVINVTRSADNATSIFYTDPMQTYFTTGPNNTGTSFSSWIGASTAYVNILYNQNNNDYTSLGNNYLFQDDANYRPQIAIQNGKYVIQFVNLNNRQYLNARNGTTPNTIFSHFQPIFNNTADNIMALVQTENDYGLRFIGTNSATASFNEDSGGDWYFYSNQGDYTKKNAYVNNISSTSVTMGSWNVLATSVTNRDWRTSIHKIGYDQNNGVGNRGLNGYMVEIILNNKPMSVTEMQQFYNNRLF